jgi:cell wall-associated NlpC family hydrolase
MASESGISGTAVGVATLGLILVYAGFRGVSPLQALRDAASGKPPKVTGKPTEITGAIPGFSSNNAGRNAVVAAAQKYVGDMYSQLKRTQPGFSDCSSFVDKALMDAGINPPQSKWASTANYRLSPEWVNTTAASSGPGDVAVSATHMVLITGAGGTSAIGQQNPQTNVRTGTVAQLMTNAGPYVYKTFKGYGGLSVTDPTKLPDQKSDPTLGGLFP